MYLDTKNIIPFLNSPNMISTISNITTGLCKVRIQFYPLQTLSHVICSKSDMFHTSIHPPTSVSTIENMKHPSVRAHHRQTMPSAEIPLHLPRLNCQIHSQTQEYMHAAQVLSAHLYTIVAATGPVAVYPIFCHTKFTTDLQKPSRP